MHFKTTLYLLTLLFVSQISLGNAGLEISSRKEESGKVVTHEEIVTNNTKIEETLENKADKSTKKEVSSLIASKTTSGQKLSVKTVSLRIAQKKTDKRNTLEHHKGKAEQHEYYYHQFSKRSKFLEKKVKEHQEKSEKHQKLAEAHEKKAKEFLQKSRESRKSAESFQSLAAQYLARSKTEIKTYSVVEAEAREAAVLSKGYETEAKDHFIWAADLRRRAEKLLHLAQLHKKLASEAEQNSKKLKDITEEEDVNSKRHLELAHKSEAKHLQSHIRAKEYARQYEDYLVKSRVEKNFARQSKIKAMYEEALAKAFEQTALEMKAIAKIEEGEYTVLKNKAESAGKAAMALETAAVVVKV